MKEKKIEVTINKASCVLVTGVRESETHYPAQVAVYRTYNSRTSAAEYEVVIKCASLGCSRCCSLRTYLPYVPGSVARGRLADALFLACDELERVPLDIEPRNGQQRLQ